MYPSNEVEIPTGPITKGKKINIFLILSIIFGVLAVVFGILMFFQISEKNRLMDEVSSLKTQVSVLSESKNGAEKKVIKGSPTIQGDELDDQGLATQDTGTVAVIDNAKYLEPEGWSLRFKYPEGVTDIAYATSPSYDGSIYITGIAKGGKIYDVNICGGKEKYNQYPFFLGAAYKWNTAGEHEEWDSSPATYDGVKKVAKVGTVEYFVDTAYGGGCEIGESEDYNEATKLAKELLDSFEKKQ